MEEKVEFHRLLLKAVSEGDSRTRLDIKQYSAVPIGESESFGSDFLDVVLRRYSSATNNEKSCIFGGWISRMKSGVCRHPYQHKSEVGYQPCGLKNVHRCNPILFGESDQGSVQGSKPGKGICVRASAHSTGITWACFKKAYGSEDGSVDVKRFRQHLNKLETVELYLGQYLATAAEIVEEHCSENPNDFCSKYLQGKQSCERLKESFFAKTGANPSLVGCLYSQSFSLEDELKSTILQAHNILKVYYPVIEESRAWQKMRQEAMVAAQFHETGFWSHRCSPLTIILDNKDRLSRSRNCREEKAKLEDEMLAETPWGKMSLRERAEEIYRLAKDSYRDMKSAADNFITVSGNIQYADYNDGANVFHDYVKPELAACISFHETEGSLHPFIYNNKRICDNPPRGQVSTAYGLGQATRTTTEDMKNSRKGQVNHLPLNTPEGKKLVWPGISDKEMTGEEIYNNMIFLPKFQMELVMRMINEKAKLLDMKKNDLKLDHLIEQYSGGAGSKIYNQNIHSCLKCFGEGRSASDCYCELEKHVSSVCKK